LRKYLVLFAVVALLSFVTAAAFAADITPKTYSRTYNDGTLQTVTHPYGFWNNPETAGREAYNYNNPQDYTYSSTLSAFQAAPHGNYSTGTHKCRECHAVHRAAGKFKLTRADTRVEACDWCHGGGAGSGWNIQMDNDDAFTQEYNVGHTLGFGTSDGKYKAPDDTYPAYTPKYYMGGFSCIDCHSPHGNQQRILGYNNFWNALGWSTATATSYGYPSQNWLPSYGIANPGWSFYSEPWRWSSGAMAGGAPVAKPGSWILVKDPDQEIAWTTITPSTTLAPVFVQGQAVVYGPYNPIPAGAEIPDLLTEAVNVSAIGTDSAINKVPTDWERVFGGNKAGGDFSFSEYTTGSEGVAFTVSEFCTDCHDGNAGLSTKRVAMFSEDRAVRGDAVPYDLGYGHDTQPRH